MNLEALLFLNEKNLQTGIKIKFQEIETPKGKVMLFIDPKGKKFVIQASINNFNRFKKWNNKESIADILILNKSIKTKEGKFPLTKIRTDVEIKDDNDKDEKPEDDNEGNMIF